MTYFFLFSEYGKHCYGNIFSHLIRRTRENSKSSFNDGDTRAFNLQLHYQLFTSGSYILYAYFPHYLLDMRIFAGITFKFNY